MLTILLPSMPTLLLLPRLSTKPIFVVAMLLLLLLTMMLLIIIPSFVLIFYQVKYNYCCSFYCFYSYLLPSIPFPPLPLFELFVCSSLVTADDDDDDDDYADEYDFTTTPDARCLSFCCIPKSIVVVLTSSIDISNSPSLTVS